MKKIVNMFIAFGIIALLFFVSILTASALPITIETADNNCYVSSLRILKTQDGDIAAELDANDETGNDSSSSNGRVRTFDYVNYTLDYTTDLIDKTKTTDTANLDVVFTLDVDPRKATFTDDSLNWMINKAVTYYYEDGTTSTTWNQSKTVVKQVLTGTRVLMNTADTNMIPGTGQLSVAIYVKAAKDGDTFTPTFSATINGADESYKKDITADTLTCTCVPHYNIVLKDASYDGQLVYFDKDGTKKSYMVDDSSLTTEKGRMFAYGLVVELYNKDNRGLCGIELPSGNITFDIDTSYTIKTSGISTDISGDDYAGYNAYLWDYCVSTSSNKNKTGQLGRLMYHYSNTNTTYAVAAAPHYNKANAADGVYNGGNISMVADSSNPMLYHVTLSGYEFDLDDFTFPTRNLGDGTTTVRYGANVGAFTAAHLQFAVTFPKENTMSGDLYFAATAENLSATSLSGTTVTTEEYSKDNSVTEHVYLSKSGSWDKWIYFRSLSSGKSNSSWNAGDSYTLPGSTVQFSAHIYYSGEQTIQAYNQLVKFDDKCFKMSDLNKLPYTVSTSNPISEPGTVHAMYAAKPDQTGWKDDAEMCAMREENLIYFKTLAELENAGYTCVGVLYEVRDAVLLNNNGIQGIYTKAQVKTSVTVGSVYAITNDTRGWFTQSITDDLWENVVYDSSIGAYGLGDMEWNVGDSKNGWNYYFYSKDKGNMPVFQDYTNYTKTSYTNGAKTIGTHSPSGCYSGDSLLIVGAQNGITVEITDIGDDGYKRTSYDMDRGQRTVTYQIKPTLSAVSSSSSTEEIGSTTIFATVTLPYDLTYVTGSSSSNNITVVKNDDGTSTLTWSIPDCEVGKEISPISFSCLIGHAGEADDVENADNITIQAQVTSSFDTRKCTIANGNLDTETFNVIRLAATAVSKKTDKALMDLGDTNVWELKYGNSSDVNVRDTRIYDVLPYQGDALGSSFAGSYKVTKIVLDLSSATNMYNALKTGYVFKYTTDPSIRTASTSDVIDTQTFTAWTLSAVGTADDVTQTITFDNLNMSSLSVYGLWFDLGTLYGHEYITINVSCSYGDINGGFLDTDGKVQEAGNRYRNIFYEYANPLDQSAIVTSNSVETKVVRRDLGGTVWYDTNSNNIRNSTENTVSGETVSIYRKTPSSYGSNTITVNMGGTDTVLYDAYDVYGNKLNTITTDDDGTYLYEKLEAGDYVVVFGGYDNYGVSQRDIGGDDFKDSDAKVTLNDNRLTNAYIEITMPQPEDMSDYHYESLNNDLGLIEYRGTLSAKKTDENGEKLFGAVFELSGTNTQTITINGTTTIENLSLGTYTLREITAPTNYQLDGTAHKIVVSQKAEYAEDGNGNFAAQITVDGTVSDVMTLINKSNRTKVSITKNWIDDNNNDGMRTVLNFTLTGSVNGKVISTKTETMPLGLTTLVFESLPVMYGSQPIVYSIAEDAVAGYTTDISEISGSAESGYAFTVTNTHENEKAAFSVVKTWDDNGDEEKIRPTSIKVTLHGSDEDYDMTLTKDSGWTGTFEELPVYENGQKIDYYLTEEKVDRYVPSMTLNGTTFEVTNILDPETISVPITKIWNDEDNADKLRQPITVVLLADGKTIDKKILDGSQIDENGNWTTIFDDMLKYKNDAEILYSIREIEVSGYTTSISETDNGFTITNTHKVQKKENSNGDDNNGAGNKDNTPLPSTNTDTQTIVATGDASIWIIFASIVVCLTAMAIFRHIRKNGQ